MIADQPRELDAEVATDYLFATIGALIERAPGQVLIVDRAKLSFDWRRKLLIEVGDSWVAFSFPPESSGLQ